MKRLPILITMLIIAVMFGTVQLCSPKEKNTQVLKPDKELLKLGEKQISQVELRYQKNMELIHAQNDSLKRELSKSKLLLKASRTKLHASQTALLSIAQKDTLHEPLEKKLLDCDSLKILAIQYVQIVDSAGGACDDLTQELEQMMALKDSQLLLCKNSYEEIKQLSLENLERQRKLTADLQTAFKEQHKKIIQNKLLAGGFLILSGIATTLYLKSRQ